jgi:hypothetical protein
MAVGTKMKTTLRHDLVSFKTAATKVAHYYTSPFWLQDLTPQASKLVTSS